MPWRRPSTKKKKYRRIKNIARSPKQMVFRETRVGRKKIKWVFPRGGLLRETKERDGWGQGGLPRARRKSTLSASARSSCNESTPLFYLAHVLLVVLSKFLMLIILLIGFWIRIFQGICARNVLRRDKVIYMLEKSSGAEFWTIRYFCVNHADCPK